MSWDWEWVQMVKWNSPFRSHRSNRENWSTSKGGPLFSKLFRLDRTDPFGFRPKFPEILVEWITPQVPLRSLYGAVRWETFGTRLILRTWNRSSRTNRYVIVTSRTSTPISLQSSILACSIFSFHIWFHKGRFRSSLGSNNHHASRTPFWISPK